MTALSTYLKAFFDAPEGKAILVILALGVLRLVTGALRAYQDGTFQWSALNAWVRSVLAPAIIIAVVLFTGHLLGGLAFADSGDVPGLTVTAAGLAAAATFVATQLAAIGLALKPPADKPPQVPGG